jgi:hypothetical protein
MELSFQINTTKLHEKLESLRQATGKDMGTLVRDEAKHLSQTIVKFIPPIGAGGKQVGEHAVEAGIKAVFSEATPKLIDEVGAKYGLRNVSTFVTEQDGSHVNLNWDLIDPLGSHISSEHKGFRDGAGRTPKGKRSSKGAWSARVVVPFGTLPAYMDKVKSHVGTWKASWAFTAAMLGHKFPKWIARHWTSLGMLTIYRPEGLANEKSPSIIFGSRFPGNFRMASSIQQAVRARENALRTRIRRVLKGYADDWRVQDKITPQAEKVAAVETVQDDE